MMGSLFDFVKPNKMPLGWRWVKWHGRDGHHVSTWSPQRPKKHEWWKGKFHAKGVR